MTADYDRDLRGYGANPPDPKWPGGARIALNFVINVEEGSEPSMQDGDGFTETQHTEAFGRPAINGRDLAGESMFEYGSRVGFWRLLRLFQERDLPLTMFACALALERNPEIANAIRGSDADVCSHGWRWIKHFELSEGFAFRNNRSVPDYAHPIWRKRVRRAGGSTIDRQNEKHVTLTTYASMKALGRKD